MRYESSRYATTVQRAFAVDFAGSIDLNRGEMRDSEGRTITTDGHLSHEVRTGVDGAYVARLRIYSYRKCIAQWWRVPVGMGHRVFGWNAPPAWSSVTTTKHINDLTAPHVFNDGVQVILPSMTPGRIFDEVGQVPDLEVLQVLYDKALGHTEPGFIPAARTPMGAEVVFISEDLGSVCAEVWRDDNPGNVKKVEVPAMNYRSLLRGLHMYELGLTHAKKPKHIVWQSPTQGYFVNAREKVVGYWKVPEVTP